MRLKFGKLIQALSPAQLIALYYFLAVTVAVILLSLPAAHKPGRIGRLLMRFLQLSVQSV